MVSAVENWSECLILFYEHFLSSGEDGMGIGSRKIGDTGVCVVLNYKYIDIEACPTEP